MSGQIRCIIVDDEHGAIEILQNYISKVSRLDLISAFTDPLEALDFLSVETVDLVFMDINMPDLSGLQLSRLIQSSDTAVIFCTAYPEHALESYEIQAVDYLVKPIPFERFLAAVKRLESRSSEGGGESPELSQPGSGSCSSKAVQRSIRLMRTASLT